MDAFRQPKFSYYMFCSQRPAEENKELIADSGPMVYIANEMTPFSPKDVTVYSNCEEVRLTFCKNGKQHIYHKPIDKVGMPSPVIPLAMFLILCMISNCREEGNRPIRIFWQKV